jgi:hypothetical protein
MFRLIRLCIFLDLGACRHKARATFPQQFVQGFGIGCLGAAGQTAKFKTSGEFLWGR